MGEEDSAPSSSPSLMKKLSSSSSSSFFYSLLSSPRGYVPALFLSFFFAPHVLDVKKPFHPVDVLPLLPRTISSPVVNYISRPEDLLPKYVGSATDHGVTKWRGACFRKSEAKLEFHNKSGTDHGGATLHITVDDGQSYTCIDLYIFSTPYQATWDQYYFRGGHTLEFQFTGKPEYDYVKQEGVSIFMMQGRVLRTVKALWEVFPLFTNTGWGENKNIEFLQKRMGAKFVARPEPAWITRTLNPDDIQSGDFIAVSKIRGRWGAFQSLQKWVTGSFAGHAAVCIRDPQGKLWVAESGRENAQGGEIIDLVAWEEWWNFELTKDEANPHIALLPLRADLRAKFNGAAAWEFAQSMKGKPYGYQNLVFSWIDTVKSNYPDPVDANLVASFMTIFYRFKPAFAGKLWKEALNKRLGTQDLEIPEIMTECQKRGILFGSLLAYPEEDAWVYPDGNSLTCVAFVVAIYKRAGLLDQIADNVQATEFTVKDGYMLNFFEEDMSRLPKWCNEGDTVKLPFCQIRGKYRMELRGYNSLKPYRHMNEVCPSMPPHYDRPTGC